MALKDQQELEDKFVMHTFGRKPVELVSGKGMTVTDSDGKTYLDFIGGIGACSLGHCHPAVVDAISAQAAKLIHVSNYYYIEKRGQVAKKVSDLLNECVPNFFSAPFRSFFANSGAEANECAIKLARLYSKKEGHGGQTIVTLDSSFHGRTLATLAATAQPAKQEAFAPLPGGFMHAPINDLKTLAQIFEDHPNEICAVMVECIQGESGVHPCKGDFLVDAIKLCRGNNALLIADEVQTGMYRCGDFPFAFQHYGITPDIITIAKGIASGFPMGICSARIEVAEAFEPGDHGSTFGGSNLAIAAANATLDTFAEMEIGPKVTAAGDHLFDALSSLDDVTALRGLGLMIACDLAEGISAPDVVAKGLEEGLLLNATGPSTLRFLPPLICTDEDINALMEKLPGAIAACKA